MSEQVSFSGVGFLPVDPPVVSNLQVHYSDVFTASVAWGSATLAMYYPFVVHNQATFAKLWWLNAATVAGNTNLGVYDIGGTLLVSTGLTANSGASLTQSASVTSTTLRAGVYYFGLYCSDATHTYVGGNNTAVGHYSVFGNYQDSGSLSDLPSTAAFAAVTTTRPTCPVGLAQGSVF